ncbi:MAG: flagellar biosynthetic protein FliO [Treponema sp.]|nr:flagellar biosynthetic protein FliO [Treponema sp.]
MILILAVTAAAIYGIVYIFKRAAKQPVSKDPFLKVLSSAHLGANRYAHIVAVGSRAWLLGSGEGGVSLVSEIEDKEIIDAMLLEDSKKDALSPSGFPDFMSFLRRQGINAGESRLSADNIRKRRERLREL